MAHKKSYAELKAIHAKVRQEQKEAEALARTQAGEYETSTISVKKRKRRVRKNKAGKGGHAFGGFYANESKDRKSGEMGLGPEW